jgi:hypothetical protein
VRGEIRMSQARRAAGHANAAARDLSGAARHAAYAAGQAAAVAHVAAHELGAAAYAIKAAGAGAPEGQGESARRVIWIGRNWTHSPIISAGIISRSVIRSRRLAESQ